MAGDALSQPLSPPKPRSDYLVDHSIIMYLMDPDGEFVTFYGKNFTATQLANSISESVRLGRQLPVRSAAQGLLACCWAPTPPACSEPGSCVSHTLLAGPV
jgi:hypothetical protein